MISTIFGNQVAAKLMLYLFHHGEAYASGAAKDMEIALSQVQKQLDKFEKAGVLVSKRLGTTRIYQFNPKLGVVKKLKDLIEAFYESMSLHEREQMFSVRRRPRAKGKPVLKE